MAAVALAFVVGVIGVIAFLILKMQSAAAEEDAAEKRREQEKAGKRRGGGGRAQRGEDEEGDEEGSEGEGEGADEGRATGGNAAKEAKKNERKAQQAAAAQAKAERDKEKNEKQAKYNAIQQEKEKAYAKLDAKREEEQKKAKDEKAREKKAQEDKLKEMFAVDAEGDGEAALGEPGAVERFVDFVKIRKAVELEDLAAQFRIKTQSAIDRLQDLEKLGQISGIFDDRGKFIYITAEEMQEVTAWLQQAGRIDRAALVEACNRLVSLEPTKEDRAKLEAEAKSAAAELDVNLEAEKRS